MSTDNLVGDRFNFGVRLGIFLTVEAAALSLGAVSLILAFIGRRHYQRSKRRNLTRKQNRDVVDSAPRDVTDSSYFLNLMLAEMVQAIGGLLNIRHMADGFVTEGPYCRAQGALKQIGDVGVALTSLVIAIHTFSVLVLRWHAPPIISKAAICSVWLFIAVVVGIGAGINKSSPNYYGNTGLWCWIGKEYKTERIVLEYLWLWVAGGIMLLIYGFIALDMRGVISLDQGIRFFPKASQEPQVEGGNEAREIKKIANLMMFYPLVYLITIAPVSIVRWLQFSGHSSVPAGATIFGSVLFSLSGFGNVVLYKLTRPDLVGTSSDRESETEEYPMETTHKKAPTSSSLGHLPDMPDNEVTETPVHRDSLDLGRLPSRD